MRPLAYAAFALTLAAGAASAASAQGANTNPAVVKPGLYKVEPTHTRILFSVSHMGFTTWYGDFTGASGTLKLDPARPAASQLAIQFPTASVSTTNATLDGELKGAEWFDAAKYPTIRFVSRSVRVTGPGRADVTGELTLHGVTRPVTLHARFNGSGVNPLDKAYTVGFDASGQIKRSQFGVTKYVPLVGDQVTLILSGAFELAK